MEGTGRAEGRRETGRGREKEGENRNLELCVL